jgi:hypothetical protein
MKESKDSVSEYAAKCLTCFLACLERFIKFLNKHAYVEVAMRSKCFCVSAVNGAKVVLTNSLRFGVLHGLGEIIMNIAVFFIVVSGTYFGYIMIKLFGPEKKEFHGTAGSLIVTSVTNTDCLFDHVCRRYSFRSYLGSEQRCHIALLLHR